MKNISSILFTSLFLCVSCNQGIHKTVTKDVKASDVTKETKPDPAQQMLSAKLEMAPEIKTGDSIGLRFTVYNNTASTQKFCKWHTPFEPLMSKYLDITDANGAEAQYKGPMAKRIMPPPASSYITLAPKDSISVSVNLLSAYDITKPAKYTVHYNAEQISGLKVSDSISFLLTP